MTTRAAYAHGANTEVEFAMNARLETWVRYGPAISCSDGLFGSSR